jgi:hypothetical protein
MTFIEFKKMLLDAEITLPKFCRLIKVSDKNIQSYKKKGTVPNTIAVIAVCFARLHQDKVDYRPLIEGLNLKKQTKKGGVKKKSSKNEDISLQSKEAGTLREDTSDKNMNKKT